MNAVDSAALAPSAAPARATLRDFLSVLFRRKWIVLILPLVTIGVVAYINLSNPPLYSSFARLVLRRGTHESALESNLTILPREEELATQVEIARSVAVINRAQEILEHRPGKKYRIDPASASAGVVGESNVVDVTYESLDPQGCPIIAQALADAFMEYHKKAFSVPARNQFLKEQAEASMAEIERWRAIKEQLLASRSQVDPGDAARNLLAMLLEDQRILQQTRTRRVQLEADLAGQEELAAKRIVDLPYEPTTSTMNEPWIIDLKKDLQDLRVKMEELRGRYSDTHPQVLAVKDQIVQVEEQLRREVSAHTQLQGKELATVRAEENHLQHAVDSLGGVLHSYPGVLVRVEEASAMIVINQELYKAMRDRQDRALVATNATPDWTASLLVPAVQAFRVNKLDYVRMALAPILALAIAIGLAFFVDSLDHSLKSVREVEDVLGLPVVASVPEVK